MRRVARLERSIDLLRSRPVPCTTSLLCSACKQHTASLSTSARRAEKKPFTERIRSKIWGTDTPLGQKDPYADATSYNRLQKQMREEEQQEQKQLSAAEYQKLMESYEPATTAEGLDSVGGFGGWWRQNWDPEHQFEGFNRKAKTMSPAQIHIALHQAVVEVFTLQQAGQPLSTASFKKRIDSKLSQQIANAQFIQSDSGVVLDTGAVQELIIQSLAPEEAAPTESEADIDADRSPIDPLHEETDTKSDPTESEEDVAADRSTVDPLEAKTSKPGKDFLGSSDTKLQKSIEAWDPVWLQISLQDTEVKFAVFKRMLQLTGRRIPDSAIGSIRSVQDILNHLITPPKPRKVIDALSQKLDVRDLPNVSIKSRRITPIDKEVSVGRWKVITKELKERGLPSMGN